MRLSPSDFDLVITATFPRDVAPLERAVLREWAVALPMLFERHLVNLHRRGRPFGPLN